MAGYNSRRSEFYDQTNHQTSANTSNLNVTININTNIQSMNRSLNFVISSNNLQMPMGGQPLRRSNLNNLSALSNDGNNRLVIRYMLLENGQNEATTGVPYWRAERRDAAVTAIIAHGPNNIRDTYIQGHNNRAPYPIARTNNRIAGYARSRNHHNNNNLIGSHCRNNQLRSNLMYGLNNSGRSGRYNGLTNDNSTREHMRNDFNSAPCQTSRHFFLDDNNNNMNNNYNLIGNGNTNINNNEGSGSNLPRSRELGGIIRAGVNVYAPQFIPTFANQEMFNQVLNQQMPQLQNNYVFQNLNGMSGNEYHDGLNRIGRHNVQNDSNRHSHVGNIRMGSEVPTISSNQRVRKFRSKFTKQNDQTPDDATKCAIILMNGIDGIDYFAKRRRRSLPH